MKQTILFSLILLLSVSVSCAQEEEMMEENMMEKVTMVGGEAMYPEKNIIQNAVNSKVHTTLVAAVKAAGLVETLSGPGPFTVFAPTNDAFENLPDGTVKALLKPENKEKLINVLTYHVVPGTITYEDMAEMLEESGGKAQLETVSGEMLTIAWNGPHNIVVWDANGNIAHISTYNVMQSNGVIHEVDAVLLP